jgi:hypothetical protein
MAGLLIIYFIIYTVKVITLTKTTRLNAVPISIPATAAFVQHIPV